MISMNKIYIQSQTFINDKHFQKLDFITTIGSLYYI